MIRAFPSEKGINFVYGKEVKNLDIDWSLDNNTIARIFSSLPRLSDSCEKHPHLVVSDENHVIILRENEAGGFEYPNFAAIVNIQNHSPFYCHAKHHRVDHNIGYKFKYMQQGNIKLRDDYTITHYSDLEGIVASILTQIGYNKSTLDDFP